MGEKANFFVTFCGFDRVVIGDFAARTGCSVDDVFLAATKMHLGCSLEVVTAIDDDPARSRLQLALLLASAEASARRVPSFWPSSRPRP